MNLLVRINLVLALAFTLAALAVGWACSAMLQENAKQETLREAGLMMDSALSMRAYTSAEIVPLLNAQMQKEFLPQSVPSYAATQNFLHLHETAPGVRLQGGDPQPHQPAGSGHGLGVGPDTAVPQRRAPRARSSASATRPPAARCTSRARSARRRKCLVCHSVPAAAPATLIARYGSNNGFGWQVHEIIGAQVVSVPLADRDRQRRPHLQKRDEFDRRHPHRDAADRERRALLC